MATLVLRTSTRRVPRIKPHVPYEHPQTPGICSTCQLPIYIDGDGRYVNRCHVTLDELLASIVASGYDTAKLAGADSG